MLEKLFLVLLLVLSMGISVFSFLRFRLLPDGNHDFAWNKQRYENAFLLPSIDVLLCVPVGLLLKAAGHTLVLRWQFGIIIAIQAFLLVFTDVTERAVRDRAIRLFGQDFGKMTMGKWIFTFPKTMFLLLWLEAWF